MMVSLPVELIESVEVGDRPIVVKSSHSTIKNVNARLRKLTPVDASQVRMVLVIHEPATDRTHERFLIVRGDLRLPGLAHLCLKCGDAWFDSVGVR
jgi:hypothetical protein